MNKKITFIKSSMPTPVRNGFTKMLKTLGTLALLITIFTAGCAKDDFEGEVVGVCPTVITDPLDKAVDVVLNKVITITFNTDMDAATINNQTVSFSQGTTVLPGTIAATADAKVFTFTPATALLPFTVYSGKITTEARDTFKTGLAADFTWSFTTIPTITLTATPAIGGNTIGSGSFAEGATVTVTATPNTGYVFTSWTLNGAVASTSSAYTLTMAGNKTLVANFTPIVAGQFAVVLSANPVVGGSSVGSGAYVAGSTVSIDAVANTGYTFSNWTEGAVVVSTNHNYQFVITANRTLVANYIAGTTIPIVTPTPQAGINLGTAGTFATMTKAGISTTGTTTITGDIGVSPSSATSITGFGLIMDTDGTSSHTPIVTGKVYAADYTAPTPAKMTTAVSDMETAFTEGNARITPAPIVGLYAGDISGRTLPAGLYKWSTGVLISNAGVTLNGGPNDVWIFQVAQDLTVNNSAIITLTGGAQAKNIYWVVSGQATLGSNSDFSGIILSKTLISLNTGAKVTGRLLAQTAVTLNAATVIQP